MVGKPKNVENLEFYEEVFSDIQEYSGKFADIENHLLCKFSGAVTRLTVYRAGLQRRGLSL